MNQEVAILNHLIEHGSITSFEAFKNYGCTRLSAKIFDLRKRGYVIDTDRTTLKNRYGNPSTFARYRLISKPAKTSLL